MEWSEPVGFSSLDPPRAVRALLHLGTLPLAASHGGADEHDDSRVAVAIERAPFWDADGRRRAAEVWQLARSGRFVWVADLAEAAADIDVTWRRIVQIVWCAWSADLPTEALSTGATGARVNTLLDVTGANLTSVEITATLSELAEAVLGGSPTAFQDWTLAITGNPVAGFVVDAVTFGLGSHAMTGFTRWFERRVNRSEEWVDELTLRYALAHQLRPADPDRTAGVAERLYHEAIDLGLTGDDARRSRMTLAAHAALARQDDSLSVRMPPVTGLKLSEAGDVLRAMGASIDLIDATDQKRRVLDRSKWVVSDQAPAAGEPIDTRGARLSYARPGDSAP